jgi:hypothetical protein
MKACKYCGESKALVRSHIIPRAFYEIKSLKQKASNKSLSMLSDSEDSKPIKRPIGIYDEELFCKDCENKFMIYDDYAFKLLNERSSHRKAFRDEEGQVLGLYYETYEYHKLKLFFMSVLLRAGLSEDSFFQHVKLGPYIEFLKEAIDAQAAPDSGGFAVFLAYYDEIRRGPVIFPPAPQRIEKVRFYHFHLGRVIFYIKADKRDAPEELQPIILKPGGKLFLIKFSLRDSNAYDILSRIVKNPSNTRYFSA